MIKKFLIAAAVLSLFSGCASVDPAKLDQFNSTIPKCTASVDCDIKWAAGRTWILSNSKLKFQHITPDYMETYNPSEGDPVLGFRVNKEPLGGDEYQIKAAAWCGNIFGCSNPTAIDALISFNASVNSVKK